MESKSAQAVAPDWTPGTLGHEKEMQRIGLPLLALLPRADFRGDFFLLLLLLHRVWMRRGSEVDAVGLHVLVKLHALVAELQVVLDGEEVPGALEAADGTDVMANFPCQLDQQLVVPR